MFKAWWIPFSQFGVIHGDPAPRQLYRLSRGRRSRRPAQGINLLDYGCIRIFPPKFVGGVVDLYEGLLHDDFARTVHAYETWGFHGLTRELVEILNIWARFIYGPLLDDRVRSVADGVAPGKYGRKEAFRVHQALKQHKPVRVPREFVFMDRAAIGLGGVFLHLDARLNFHRLFNETLGTYCSTRPCASGRRMRSRRRVSPLPARRTRGSIRGRRPSDPPAQEIGGLRPLPLAPGKIIAKARANATPQEGGAS